jgi:uncharacterized membrane protein
MYKHRLELFSDGVFAIDLTLLVLDLKGPSRRRAGGLERNDADSAGICPHPLCRGHVDL